MVFDPREYLPRPASWFSPTVAYTGAGVAEFEDPKGSLEGRATVEFDRFGNSTHALHVERVSLAEPGAELIPKEFHLPYLLSGGKPNTQNRSMIMYAWPGVRNTCVALQVKTADGIYEAHDVRTVYRYGHLFDDDMSEVTFEPLHSSFQANTEDGAAYFVAPLWNFVSEPQRFHSGLAQHPLRLYISPSIPEDMTGDEKTAAEINATSRRVFGFMFGGAPAFIDLLPDFDAIKKQLDSREYPRAITSVLVGETTKHNGDEILAAEVGVHDLLSVLSLATGSRVGSPWIETRSKSGGLIRRTHWELAKSSYRKGMGALGSGLHQGGIDQLLQEAQASSEFGKQYIRAVISQAVLGGYFEAEGNVEDSLSHFFRAIDALVNQHGSRKSQKPSEYLDPTSARRVNGTVGAAVRTLKKLRSGVQEGHDPAELDALIKRLKDALNKPHGGYGASFRDLLQKFCLPDVVFLNWLSKTYPLPSGERTWESVVARYRGEVLHGAWFDWAEPTSDKKERWRMGFHLHDIIVRIVLKLLGYSGHYTPSVPELWGQSMSLDWPWERPERFGVDVGYSKPSKE